MYMYMNMYSPRRSLVTHAMNFVLATIIIMSASCGVNDIIVLQKHEFTMGARVTFRRDEALEARGRFTELCMRMLPGYSVDIGAQRIVDEHAGAIDVRAQAYLKRGGYVELRELSALGTTRPGLDACLSGVELERGDVVLRVDVFSSQDWTTDRVVWLSVDKI